MEDLEDFGLNTQKLLIRTRLDLESEFQEGKKKKSFLWGKVIAKIKEIKPNFELSREQTSRKFLNLQTTYRRIKNRNNMNGRIATSWEFYDLFDEVYGTKHSINPPAKNMQSSLNTVEEIVDEEQDVNANDSICSLDNLTVELSHQKKPKIAHDNDTLEYLKQDAERDEERHEEVMELERRKIEVEQERIKTMIELKNVLEKMLEK